MTIYRKITLSQIPRILGLGDRSETSTTFGCFDRYYWHYKLLDVPNARFQEAAFLLALLYKNAFEGNIFYGKEQLLKWITGAINFWCNVQNRDGSFNEVYPHERSFCATAFSAYAMTETMLELKLADRWDVRRAGDWLTCNSNEEVSNQMASASLALFNIYTITRDAKYLEASKEKLDWLLSVFNKLGYFPEYGGYDIGYQSIVISSLAKYWKKTQDKTLYAALNDAAQFVNKLLRPNGSYDNSRTSRKTQFLYPYGFAVLRSPVIEKHRQGLESDTILNPAWMDDRYCIAITLDYMQAYLETFEWK